MSVLQGCARAQGRNVSGAGRQGGSPLRRTRGTSVRGFQIKILGSHAGAWFTRGIRRFEQPSRDEERGGRRNEAKLPADKQLLAQSATVGRDRRHRHEGFRQRSGVVTHLVGAFCLVSGNRSRLARIAARPATHRRRLQTTRWQLPTWLQGYRDGDRDDREKIHTRRQIAGRAGRREGRRRRRQESRGRHPARAKARGDRAASLPFSRRAFV